MNNILVLRPVKIVCDHDDLEACEKCIHARCEYCNEIGVRKAQTFEALFGHGPKSIIFYECQKPACVRHRDYDFDMGKAMAKGEL